MLFVLPPIESLGAAFAPWVIGGLFVAPMVLNPFAASFHPADNAKSGPLRRLPVELTLVNDLPVNNEPQHARLWFGDTGKGDPGFLVYFLDDNAYDREADKSFWTRGRARAEFIIKTDKPIRRATFTVSAGPVATDVHVTIGRRSQDAAPRAGRLARPACSRCRRGCHTKRKSKRSRGRRPYRAAAGSRRCSLIAKSTDSPVPWRSRQAGARSEPALRIAVVTSSPPMVEGGHMVIARSLVQALREAGHTADIIVTPQNRFGRQASAYFATWFTDVGSADGKPIDQVISLRYPSYAVRHHNHVCWLNHTMREYYDLWDRFSGTLGTAGRVKERARRAAFMPPTDIC